MWRQPKAVWAVAFASVVAFMGIGLVDPILKPIADNLNASPSQVSLLFTSYMTETGHGSDVQALETTATYDPESEEFVIDSPTPTSRKDYIGGAAETAQVATVFAQLITAGDGHGVHCFVVPIRDDGGNDLPGVTTGDCHYKGGLPGVDNGRIQFDHVRIPRENLLNKYADVAEDGTYSSPIENPGRRFFTMLGTLIRGRVTVAGSAGAAARVALAIATRYALERRQFEAPGDDHEVLIMPFSRSATASPHCR